MPDSTALAPRRGRSRVIALWDSFVLLAQPAVLVSHAASATIARGALRPRFRAPRPGRGARPARGPPRVPPAMLAGSEPAPPHPLTPPACVVVGAPAAREIFVRRGRLAQAVLRALQAAIAAAARHPLPRAHQRATGALAGPARLSAHPACWVIMGCQWALRATPTPAVRGRATQTPDPTAGSRLQARPAWFAPSVLAALAVLRSLCLARRPEAGVLWALPRLWRARLVCSPPLATTRAPIVRGRAR